MNDRETSQVYTCAECGFKGHHHNDGLRMWFLWIHYYSQHKGLNVGIDEKDTSLALLRDCGYFTRDMIRARTLN